MGKGAAKKSRHIKLTAKSKAAAKRQAKNVGSQVSNLVDSMNAARKQRAEAQRRSDEGVQ